MLRASAIAGFCAIFNAPLQAADLAKQQEQASMQQFRKDVQPLLAKHCSQCHGAEKQKADIRFDQLDPDMAKGQDGETWHDALNELNQGDMPPEKAVPLPLAAREILVDWMTSELKRATAVRRSTGGKVVMRRLTRYEYANTLRDLLGLEDQFEAAFPPEPASKDGFKNNGQVLAMSPLQVEQYLETARNAVEKAIVVGEKPQMVKFTEKNGRQTGGVDTQFPSAGLLAFKPPPLTGPFRVQITASAEDVQGVEPPEVSVHIGYQNSPKNHHIKELGKVQLQPGGAPTTFELVGNMDNFPHADPNTPVSERRNPGLRIGFGNSYYSRYPAGLVPPEKLSTKSPKPGRPSPKEAYLKKVERATKPHEEGMPKIQIHSITYEAPWYPSWPPEGHTRILFPSPLREQDEPAYAREVLQKFMRLAFRRPPTAEEVEEMMQVYTAYRKESGSLELALREVLPEILVSPAFLFLAEPNDGPKRKELTHHELAARLAYFLWSTLPDEALSKAADDGSIQKANVLESTVRRMLEDDKSWNFISHFTDQWLNLDELNRIAINPDFYPNFDSRLKADMRLETQHFFAEILRKDLSVLNLLDSDFTMLNPALAVHYAINAPKTTAFQRVSLSKDAPRGGLLGQASFLLRNSSGDDSHPILRGTWIKDRLLGDPPASPPPDVPELEKDNPDLAQLSLREQLEFHRQKESCNSCHRQIDPWGIPLENFDATGQWRDYRKPPELKKVKGKKAPKKSKVPKKPIEVSSKLPDGTELNGFQSLKTHLLEHEKDRFANAFVRRLLTYALGRNLEITDTETVAKLQDTFAQSGYQIDELLVAIVKSEAFQMK